MRKLLCCALLGCLLGTLLSMAMPIWLSIPVTVLIGAVIGESLNDMPWFQRLAPTTKDDDA